MRRYYHRSKREPTIAKPKREAPETCSGPVPHDVWETSTRIASGGETSDGIATWHVLRSRTGGHYLQLASPIGGWIFIPCRIID